MSNLERCYKCDECTGNAGPMDGSLMLDSNAYCEECYQEVLIETCDDRSVEMIRLQAECDAMREQLRWRKCSEDGDPNKHGQYLTIVEGDRVMQNYNGLWDCHEYAATTHWLPIPAAELTGEAE